jgi:hypothetical protein
MDYTIIPEALLGQAEAWHEAIYLYICASRGRLLDKEALKRISTEVEKENLLFANKTFLDNLTLPSQIIGREKRAKELVQFLQVTNTDL